MSAWTARERGDGLPAQSGGADGLWMVQVAAAGQMAHRPHLLGEAPAMACGRKGERPLHG